MSGSARRRAAAIAAALVTIVAGVHLQQYISFMSEVPTVGVLFLLNAAGGAGLAVALLSGDRAVRMLGAVGAVGLAGGALVSVAIALTSSLFGYSEPALRFPILLAIVSEAAAVVIALALLIAEIRPRLHPRRA